MTTTTDTNANKLPQSLMWIAGIAVILFSVAGIAAIMGWIPTSMGRTSDDAVVARPGKLSGNTGKPTTAKSVVQPALPSVVASNAAGAAKCTECGVVESTREVTRKGEGSGIGAVGGAVVGGLIGNQVGSGRGNTAATAIGAVGGAVAGNEVEKRMKSSTGYEITVRLDDGSSRVIAVTGPSSWRAGDHVRIVDGAIQANP